MLELSRRSERSARVGRIAVRVVRLPLRPPERAERRRRQSRTALAGQVPGERTRHLLRFRHARLPGSAEHAEQSGIHLF